MPDLHALILAGGASSRFWPLSGDEHPKYLLRPDGQRSLLRLAFERACLCTDASRVCVVTSHAQADVVRAELPELPPRNLCVEPARRDTAAAVALGCKQIAARAPEADVLALPADGLLDPPEALSRGVSKARRTEGFERHIHVFGVAPDRPETGFGYIEVGQSVGEELFEAAAFKEKPDAATAAQYLAEGRHLWNIGCFLFSLETFWRELGAHLPGHSSRLRAATAEPVRDEDYDDIEPISIDFGVIERCRHLRVVELKAAFDDIGTWDALAARMEAAGAPPAAAWSAGGEGNRVIADRPVRVAVVGASDLLVVVEGDRVLVMRKGCGQQVKEIARREAQGHGEV